MEFGIIDGDDDNVEQKTNVIILRVRPRPIHNFDNLSFAVSDPSAIII